MRRQHGTQWAVTAVIAVIAIVAASCGGSSSADEAATTTSGVVASGPDTQGLADAALAYNSAIIDPAASTANAEAIHDLLVAACRAELTVEAVQGMLVDGIEGRRVQMGAAAEAMTVGQIGTQDVGTATGDVLVRFVTPDDPDPMGWGVPLVQSWYVEDGSWRIDMCNESSTIAGGTDAYTPVRVVASGMHERPDDGRYDTNWAVVVSNPNPDAIAYDVAVDISYFDAAGEKVTATQIEDTTILTIEAGQTGAVTGTADAPKAVRMEVTARAGSWAPADGRALTFTGQIDSRTVTPPSNGLPGSTQLDGTITNQSDTDLGFATSVVFIDAGGRIVGGMYASSPGTGYAAPGATVPLLGLVPEPLPEDWRTAVYVTPLAPDYTDYRAEMESLAAEQ